jgi:hypothetical protein
MSDDDLDTAVRVTALIVLGVVLVAAIVGLTVVAVMTYRNLVRPEVLTFVLALTVAGLGGYSFVSLRRRARWRVEREELNNGTQ